MVRPLERISTSTLSNILLSGVRVSPTRVFGVVGVKGMGRLVVGAGDCTGVITDSVGVGEGVGVEIGATEAGGVGAEKGVGAVEVVIGGGAGVGTGSTVVVV